MHGSGLKIGVAPVLHEGEPQDRGHLVTLLERARDELRGNDYRRVEQVAAMRLPVHFAVGRVFPAWTTGSSPPNCAGRLGRPPHPTPAHTRRK